MKKIRFDEGRIKTRTGYLGGQIRHTEIASTTNQNIGEHAQEQGDDGDDDD